MTNVLIIDDHAAIGQGLRTLLAGEMPDLRVEAVTSWELAERALQQERWHLAILDVDLGPKSGLELIGAIKKLAPQTNILIYTFHKEGQVGVRAFRAGAKGFLNKAAPPADLFQAVQSILQGRPYIAPQMEAYIVEALAAPAKAAPHEELSTREWEVLRHIAAGRSNKEIGYALDLSPKSVVTYRARIMGKLMLRTRADIVRYAIENGIEPIA